MARYLAMTRDAEHPKVHSTGTGEPRPRKASWMGRPNLPNGKAEGCFARMRNIRAPLMNAKASALASEQGAVMFGLRKKSRSS